MGAYLSEPIVEKISSDESNEFIQVGASSMQGWRISQEDAHNSVLGFDENSSFFAVYDGHGGAEVATYCADKFPAFLKELESYKKGDYEQALKDAFLGFDETLLSDDVVDILKKLAFEKNPDKDSEMAEEGEEEEDLTELCQEGSLPLHQVLEKYKGGAMKFPTLSRLKQDEPGGSGAGTSKPLSPFLRGRRNTANVAEQSNSKLLGPSCSSSGGPAASSKANSSGPESSNKDETEIDDAMVSSSSGKQEIGSESAQDKSNEASCSNDTNGVITVHSSPDSSSTNSKDKEMTAAKAGPAKIQNGDITSYQENEVSTNSLVKAEGVSSSSSHDATPSPSTKRENGEVSCHQTFHTAHTAAASITSSTKGASPFATSEDDSSSDDDADFHAEEDNSSTEDGEEPCDDDSVEENEGEETEDEDDENDDGSGFCNNMIEEPGKDSGCTAVVALLVGRDLYVANAGDSRCVVCRNGKAIEMSFDHKPEDEEESERIYQAGGKVTLDGRVNGGLNLSRAIGDHAYKMNKDLPAEKQMISALPDVRKLIISPGDEFMILACDGIWNFMSSDEVVEFVKKRLDDGQATLSKICEELFEKCLAPNTLGDGTGCDNMTAMIIQFKSGILNLPTKISLESEAVPIAPTKKRANSPTNNECGVQTENARKRLKTEDNEKPTAECGTGEVDADSVTMPSTTENSTNQSTTAETTATTPAT